MDDRHFENRMQLLKKSYERMPSEFNPEEVLQKLDETPHLQSSKEPRKLKREMYIQKASVWLVSLVSVFILGIITATFLMNEEDEEKTGELSNEYIEQLKEEYKAEREKRRELLKMEEERFSDLSFVKWSDQMIAMITSDREIKRYIQNGTPEELKLDYEDALHSLMLPSEMVEELKKAPLSEDETASIEFLTEYRNKVQSLQSVYNEILSDYPEALELNKAEGQYNETLIMISSKGEPEEFRNMVDTMMSQNIRVKVNEGTGSVSAELRMEDVKLIDSLHQDTQHYYRMMFQEPYMVAGTLRYSIEESVQHVKEMQRTLLNVEQDHNLYPVMESYFYGLFYDLMKGSDQTRIFDGNGVVKKEYQEAWLSLSSSSVLDPTYYLLKPIIEEMKESGWTESNSYDLLTYDDLKTALVLAKEGQLEQYTEDILFENQTVDLSSASYWNRIEIIYSNFKESGYNLETIKRMHPVDALGLLEYANKVEDPVVVFHLLDFSDTGDVSEGYINEFIKSWTRKLPLLDEVEALSFDKKSLNGSAEKIHYGLVNGLKNGESFSFTMIYNEKEIWNLRLNYWFEDPSVHNEEETPINDDFMQRVHALYKNFAGTKDESALRKAKPSEIVGLYFYTSELHDYETQHALFHQDLYTEVPPLEQYLEDVQKYGAGNMKFRDLFKSISFKTDEDYDPLYSYVGGYATLYVDQNRHPDEEEVKGFRLMNTHAGWRVSFMPMQ